MNKFKLLLCFILGIFFFSTPGLASAASLSLSPSTGTFNRSCPFSIDINLDTAGVQSDGTDSILFYDNSRLTATSITPGTIYAEYPGTNVDDTTGRVTVSGLASVSQPFSGSGKLATVNFSVKANAPTGVTLVKFDFDANNMTKTTDSNVVQRGTVQDVLSSVVNGNYTVGTGNCGTTPTATTVPGSTFSQGSTGSFFATPAAEQKVFKTIDQAVGGTTGGNSQWTATLAIVGAVLTVLGILGLALL